MFLGVRVVTEEHMWNTQFVFVTLFYILIFRVLGKLHDCTETAIKADLGNTVNCCLVLKLGLT